MSSYELILRAVGGFLGLLLIYTAMRSYADPVAFARGPFAFYAATSETTFFLRAVTGRNFCAGIFVLLLAFLSDQWTMGLFLACWSGAGFADGIVVYDLARRDPKAARSDFHFYLGAIMTAYGVLMMVI